MGNGEIKIEQAYGSISKFIVQHCQMSVEVY